jgi:hypothetical protein
MANDHWESQFRTFLRRTGDELKRMGQDIKDEAQRLLQEVRDPDRQRKVKQNLREVGVWARRTAEEMADLVEEGAKKAEGALGKLSKRADSAEESTQPTGRPAGAKPRAKKSVGKKAKGAGGAAKAKKPAAKPKAKKTVGKKKKVPAPPPADQA